MEPRRYDVLVVGAGPAGSIAALVLARAGARVALLDKARFPRDKACGDFIGPRGLQVLADLGVPEPAGLDVGDMVVVGPTGRRVVLPCFDGVTYPGRARAVPRTVLRRRPPGRRPRRRGRRRWRAGPPAPLGSGAGLEGFGLDGGPSRPGRLRDRGRRRHQPRGRGAPGWSRRPGCCGASPCAATSTRPSTLPAITLWEQTPWRAFPGYGWIFPGPDGVANVGVGVGTLADRQAGSEAVRVLPAYLGHLGELGLLDRVPTGTGSRAGWGAGSRWAWSGTAPAAGRVLLVGDAAGLVNPLQGEGIAQAMTSGRAAAESSWARRGVPPAGTGTGPGPDPPPLPADHRRRSCRAGGPAPGRGRGGPAAHRPGARAGRWPAVGASSGTSCSRGRRPGRARTRGRRPPRAWGARSPPGPRCRGGSTPPTGTRGGQALGYRPGRPSGGGQVPAHCGGAPAPRGQPVGGQEGRAVGPVVDHG